MACHYGHEAIVRLLLDCVAEIGSKSNKGVTPLHMSYAVGNEAIVKLLVERGSEIDAQTNTAGATPIYCACEAVHEAVAQSRIMVPTWRQNVLLLAKNDSRQMSDCWGDKGRRRLKPTPKVEAQQRSLWQADKDMQITIGTWSGDQWIVQELGWTPLHTACQFGHKSVVALFLDCGAEMEAKQKMEGHHIL